MSLEQDFALAVLDWLSSDTALLAQVNGVFHRAPARIAPPYVLIEDVLATDWGTKDKPGREVRLALLIRDGSQDLGPVSAIAQALDIRLMAMPRTGAGHRLVSFHPLRSRTVRIGETWLVTLDYRARLLAL